MKNKRRAHRVLFSLLLSFGLILPIKPLLAASLYQDAVEQAQVSDKVLAQSLKQIKEHKEFLSPDPLSVPPFHKRASLPKVKTKGFCTTCHLALPHQKDVRSRTFMNMHATYIACETCHFRPKGKSLNYAWLAYEGVNTGFPLTARQSAQTSEKSANSNPSSHSSQFKPRPPLAPQTGARIAPFFEGDLALELKTSPFAKLIEQEWKSSDENQKAQIKARLHIPLKKEGPPCTQCHSSQHSMLDFGFLGATPTRQKEIETNILVRFFDRFKDDDDTIRIDQLLQ